MQTSGEGKHHLGIQSVKEIVKLTSNLTAVSTEVQLVPLKDSIPTPFYRASPVIRIVNINEMFFYSTSVISSNVIFLLLKASIKIRQELYCQITYLIINASIHMETLKPTHYGIK